MGWKAVRDRNQEVVSEWGVTGSWEQVSVTTWIQALARKLIEESSEYMETFNPGELWDIYDVLEELIRLHPSISDGRRQKKVDQMGVFRDRIMYTPVPNATIDHPEWGHNK